MTLREFAAILLKAGMEVYHQAAPDKPGTRYVVWQEYAARRQTGGPLLVRSIQVDFYAKAEFDPGLEGLLDALARAGIYREEPEISYDAETGYTRYMIECEIIDTTIGRKKDGKQK